MSIVSEAILRVMVGINGIEARLMDIETRLNEEKGQTLAEYGLIMAVIAVAVVVAAVVAFRTAITSAFTSATDCLDGACT